MTRKKDSSLQKDIRWCLKVLLLEAALSTFYGFYYLYFFVLCLCYLAINQVKELVIVMHWTSNLRSGCEFSHSQLANSALEKE